MSVPWASTQARASWLGVTPMRSAMATTCSSTSRFLAKSSPWKRGELRRRSSASKSSMLRIRPERKPRPGGEYGTKPMLSSRTVASTPSSSTSRPEATHAAIIPITKSGAWWRLAQDERREIFEESSHHIAIGLEYLPAVARELYHGRDLGEPFDFLAWFEYAPRTPRVRGTRGPTPRDPPSGATWNEMSTSASHGDPSRPGSATGPSLPIPPIVRGGSTSARAVSVDEPQTATPQVSEGTCDPASRKTPGEDSHWTGAGDEARGQGCRRCRERLTPPPERLDASVSAVARITPETIRLLTSTDEKMEVSTFALERVLPPGNPVDF